MESRQIESIKKMKKKCWNVFLTKQIGKCKVQPTK